MLTLLLLTGAIQGGPATGLDLLKSEAKLIRPMMQSDVARSFLDSAEKLRKIERRLLYRNADSKVTWTAAEFDRLPEAAKSGFERREYDERFYYNTAYGSPTVYALPLEVAARHGVTDLKGKKIFDFGYGMIGQLQMMAHAGAKVHGVEVEPLFAKLYSFPGDQGAFGSGSVNVHSGRWPAERRLIDSVGRGIDLFIAKNVLKMGYIHPKREANPAQLVDLGVSDQVFLKSLAGIMKPGGLVVIYNLSPKQSTAEEQYIPWADGEYPFDLALTRLAGFEILQVDSADDQAARALFLKLGYDNGSGMVALESDLFTRVTVLRKSGK